MRMWIKLLSVGPKKPAEVQYRNDCSFFIESDWVFLGLITEDEELRCYHLPESHADKSTFVSVLLLQDSVAEIGQNWDGFSVRVSTKQVIPDLQRRYCLLQGHYYQPIWEKTKCSLKTGGRIPMKEKCLHFRDTFDEPF